MISESRSSGACPIWPAPPPYSTVSPACRAGCTAVSSVDRYAESSEVGTTSQDTLPYAMVPSAETAGVPLTVSGSVADSTCGRAPTFFIVSATACDWSATSPVSALNTIWPPYPLAAGKSARSTSSPCSDWLPGTE